MSAAPSLVSRELVASPALLEARRRHLAAGRFIMPKAVSPAELGRSRLPSTGTHDRWYWKTDTLVRIGADLGGFTSAEICSVRRNANLVKARHLICWLLRRYTSLSLPGVGRMLGDRDHTSVLHACRRVDAVIAFYGVDLDGGAERVARRLWALNWRVVRR